METEKIITKEKFEKKENRKKDFIAILIGCVAIAAVALLFWVLKTEKKDTIPIRIEIQLTISVGILGTSPVCTNSTIIGIIKPTPRAINIRAIIPKKNIGLYEKIYARI